MSFRALCAVAAASLIAVFAALAIDPHLGQITAAVSAAALAVIAISEFRALPTSHEREVRR